MSRMAINDGKAFVRVRWVVYNMSLQDIKCEQEQSASLSKKSLSSQPLPAPIPSGSLSLLQQVSSLSYQSFLLHFKRYRYVYLLTFSALLLFLVIAYAKMIFAVRSSIAQLIMLQRSTYSRDIANLQIDPQPIAAREVVTQEQVLLAQKWKGIRNEDVESFSDLANEELEYYQDKYSIIDFEEQPFCLIVHTLDAHPADGRIENLKSLLMQNYNNFHVVYVDRAQLNPNPAQEQVAQLLYDHNQKRVYRLAEKKIKPAAKLQYHVVVHVDDAASNDVEGLYMVAENHCSSEEMVMFIDSSDYFIGKEVLKLFNAVYEDKKYDLAYTNFLDANNQLGSLAYMPKKKPNRTALAAPSLQPPLFAVPVKILSLILEDFAEERIPEEASERLSMSLLVPLLEYLKGSKFYIPEVNYAVNFVKEVKGSFPAE